jgi:Alternative complex III, ActD subunit
MRRGLIAEFESAAELANAVSQLKDKGYRDLETYSPYPVPGVNQRLQLERSRIPAVVFVGGLVGAAVGYAIQWYANVWHYPQNVGGRPPHAIPAFIPVTFEAAVLGAGLAAFFALLIVLRLPRPWHPVFEVEGFERASIDRFWVAIDADDPRFGVGRSTRVLEELSPLRVVPVGELE